MNKPKHTSFVCTAAQTNGTTAMQIGDKVTYQGETHVIRKLEGDKAGIRRARSALGRPNYLRTVAVADLKPYAPAPKVSKHAKTCQICGRPIHAATGFIAHHGYTRPGHGWQTDSCDGAREMPFEVSRDALGRHIARIAVAISMGERIADDCAACYRKPRTRLLRTETA